MKRLTNYLPKIKVVQIDPSRCDIIPKREKTFLTDLNFICSAVGKDVYRGRENEISQIFNSLSKTFSPNVVLLGENGVGKNAIVYQSVFRVLEKKCPSNFYDCHFVYLDIEKMIGMMPSESRKVQREISSTFEYLISSTDLIVVIDQIHLMATSPLLLYELGVLLAAPTLKVIGMTTIENFYGFFESEGKILSLFDNINIAEPKSKKVYPMIEEQVKNLVESHKVKISEDMINYTISVSTAFDSTMCNPGLALNFIEKSMIYARNHGRNEVTKQDVNSNFNFDYELFNKMSRETKRVIAYHEAGHFIVSRFSESIKNLKTTAITIIPSTYFLGVTLFEFELEKQAFSDFEYFIDLIATDLAGRIAEGMLQAEDSNYKFTSGASEDLKHATQTARAIITEYGMIESSKNVTYFCNYDLSDIALLSEERKKIIDDETHNLIQKAFERAEEILDAKKELLDLIAEELLKNEVLDEKDLDRLCNQPETKDE